MCAMCDRTYVINLASAKDRMRKMHAQLVAHGLPYTRVEGVPGAKHRDDPRVSPLCRATCTDGMIGCALSHIRVWEEVAEQGLRAALIFEDDAALVPGFSAKLERCMQDLPEDWDILLGGCVGMCHKNKTYTNPIIYILSPGLRMLSGNTSRSKTSHIFSPEFFLGLHCYVISARGARALLRHFKTVHNHIDFQMSTSRLSVLACHPPLAFQNDFQNSSISTATTPVLLNHLLSRFKDDTHVPYNYLLTVPFARHLNGWSIFFFSMGVASARTRAFTAVPALLLADVCMGNMTDVAWLLGYFVMGRFIFSCITQTTGRKA